MAKREKKAWGRPSCTDDITELLMARANLEGGLSVHAMYDLFGVKKSAAAKKLNEVKAKYPELAEFLKGLGETTQLAPREEIAKQFVEQQQAKTEVQLQERMVHIKKNLADTIEETLGHLMDMTPDELKSMKTEHKLKHIPELVKTMRLLREQSTENIQKLSLVKAVGIATARRNPKPANN